MPVSSPAAIALIARFKAAFPGEDFVALTRPGNTQETSPDDSVITYQLELSAAYVRAAGGPQVLCCEPLILEGIQFALARYAMYTQCNMGDDAAVKRLYDKAKAELEELARCAVERHAVEHAAYAVATVGGDCHREFTDETLAEYAPRRLVDGCCW